MFKLSIHFYPLIFFILFCLNGCSFSQNNFSHISRESNLLVIKHYSKILDKEKIFRIYLPENSKTDTLFPVLYVLHGVLCHSDAWTEQTDIEEMAESYKMILVFPDAENSWYLDSPIKSEIQYESYIIKELIPFIEQTFPAKKNKYARAIMGASMGGHGAMMLAAKYPNLFCSVSSFFGINKLTEKINLESNLVGPFLTLLLGPFPENYSTWKANSVYELSQNFFNQDIKIYFDCGIHDETPALITNRKLDQRLTELKIPHIYKERNGGHTKEYLNENLKEHMDFHWQNFNTTKE